MRLRLWRYWSDRMARVAWLYRFHTKVERVRVAVSAAFQPVPRARAAAAMQRSRQRMAAVRDNEPRTVVDDILA